MLKRLSNAHTLGIAALLLLLSIMLAAPPTYAFVRGFVIGTLHPLDQFDSGETHAFHDPDPYSGYLLTMEVDTRNAPIPDMQIDLRASDGSAPTTHKVNRWSSMMGREYKQFLEIDPVKDGELTIRIDTQDNEDFLIYRNIGDVIEHEAKRAAPLWIAACIPFVCAVLLFVIAVARFVKNSGKLELGIE